MKKILAFFTLTLYVNDFNQGCGSGWSRTGSGSDPLETNRIRPSRDPGSGTELQKQPGYFRLNKNYPELNILT